MISQDTIRQLATQHQTSESPNIIREYFQHVFLSELYKLPDADRLLFKGGTALRIVYASPRFSEDLDFSLFRTSRHELKKFVEDLFQDVLVAIARNGIAVELGPGSDRTSGGYFGEATFQLYEYHPIPVTINVICRDGEDVCGEVDTITNDFIPTYNILHLPKEALVEEKVFGALRERQKERDFYDLYFMLRKGMLSVDQKQRLVALQDEIEAAAAKRDFRTELGAFLPRGQQQIIADFPRAFRDELRHQLGGR